MFDSYKSRKFTQISSLPDIQNEKSKVNVSAGISNFKTIYYGREWQLPITINVSVSTNNTRGVHMSRLIKSSLKYMKGKYIEDSLNQIYEDVTKTQPNCIINVVFQYPIRDQFLDVSITLTEKNDFYYKFSLTGITSCPCSKAITGVGHMQRTILTVEFHEQSLINFEEVSLLLEECFSARLTEFLNRADEANKIIDAQENSKFVEDVVRNCLEKFPNAKHIDARSLESIHSHDAVASWSSTL